MIMPATGIIQNTSGQSHRGNRTLRLWKWPQQVMIAGIGFLGGYIAGQQCRDLETVTWSRSANDNLQHSSSAITSAWNIGALEHSTAHVEFVPNHKTDAYNPFFHYIKLFWNQLISGNNVIVARTNQPVVGDLPLWHTWVHYMEGYHNHLKRFRGKKVTLMEIGVQSAGKLPLLYDYFGSGFQYIGVDINPKCKERFETADWISIEIGNSEDRAFLHYLINKYPHVDIFLDDGGHTMNQQKVALEVMLPHVQPEGVYILEDLSTSWSNSYGGVPNGDVTNSEFLEQTTYGLIHKALDWFQYGWTTGSATVYGEVPNDRFKEPWWRIIPDQVKHIHVYNQFVVFEKGITYSPMQVKTLGQSIAYVENDLSKKYPPIDWDPILSTIKAATSSEGK